MTALVAALVVVLIGAVLFFRVSNPIIKRLEESEATSGAPWSVFPRYKFATLG